VLPLHHGVAEELNNSKDIEKFHSKRKKNRKNSFLRFYLFLNRCIFLLQEFV
jgi:hypothetical protein